MPSDLQDNCSRSAQTSLSESIGSMISSSLEASSGNEQQHPLHSEQMTSNEIREGDSGQQNSGDEFFEPIRFVNDDCFPWPAPKLFSGR